MRIGLRVVDFAITPNGRYLIAVGQPATGLSSQAQSVNSQSQASLLPGGSAPGSEFEPFDLPLSNYSLNEDLRAKRTQMIVFDLMDGSRRS